MENVYTEVNCLNCTSNNCFILKHCRREWLLLFNEKKTCFRRKSGQVIIYAGTTLTTLYFICQGKVKVVSDGLFGKRQIKRLAKTGDILGFRELDGNHVCLSSVYTIEDSLICSISRDFFLEMLKASPDMMFEVLLMLTKELRKSEWIMKNLTLLNVHEKISHALLYMHEVYGTLPGGEIDVKLTRQEIGEIACTSKEDVSRTLSEFEDEGIIKTENKKIFLTNLQELRNMIGVNDDVRFT